MCCEGCGDDVACTAPAKVGVAGMIIWIISLIIIVVFSFDFAKYGSDTERDIILYGTVVPALVGFVVSLVGFACVPNGDYPFCHFRCKNGRTLPLVAMTLNALVALIFGIVVAVAG